MDEKIFKVQIMEMQKMWGERHYPPAFTSRIWEMVRTEVGDTFVEAVNELILNYIQPPKWEQIQKAVDRARQRAIEGKTRDSFGRGFDLRGLHDSNRSADPEFVKMCMKLLSDKQLGKLSLNQFLEGCDALDSTARILQRDSSRQPVQVKFSGKDYAANQKED